MTEEQIERQVERRTDSIDARYMAGKLTAAEYRTEMKSLNDWATVQYRTRP